MKKYLEHMRTNRTPHERRGHAAQVAGILTAAVAVVWVTTLGVRFAAGQPTVANDSNNPNQTQLANVASYAPGQTSNTLEVASTTLPAQTGDYGQ